MIYIEEITKNPNTEKICEPISSISQGQIESTGLLLQYVNSSLLYKMPKGKSNAAGT
jgi:hypothetical protein